MFDGPQKDHQLLVTDQQPQENGAGGGVGAGNLWGGE